MIKITVIAPYEEFADLFKEIFHKHNQHPHKPEYEEETYELEIISYAEISKPENVEINSDVVICRGGVAYNLRRKENFIPVVEIPVAGNDLIHSLYECKQRFNSKEVAVIGPTNMILGAERLSHIVEMNIVTFLSLYNPEIEKIVKGAIDTGINTVIGGIMTCSCAKKFGANAVIIKSGEEAIWQAITEAKRVAYISRLEQEKSKRYKTIIDYAYEGVIAVDNNNRITVFNTAAQKTLNIRTQNLFGQDISHVLAKSVLRNIMDLDTKCLDEIVKYKNIQLAVNMIPILLNGESGGKVLTFQDVTKIQEIEGKIREKIYTRGHVAKYTFNSILGNSKKIKDTIQIAQKFSMVDSNIVIYGETGTGKELFAQSIHNYSSRKNGPFVAVNCATLTENLLESELFGYVEGAFTGAIKGGKPGLFELAHRGTIFLDEISETSLKLQGQLLRVLQEKEIRRIGHDRIIPVNVRVITASNKDLNSLVHKGLFREDLYYRLNILKINIPPLRDRKDDILVIADSFIKEYLLQLGVDEIKLTDKAKEFLTNYYWPGNIRQLKNICEQLVVLNQFNILEEDDVERVIMDCETDKSIVESPNEINHKIPYVNNKGNSASDNLSYMDELKQIERNRIIAALDKAGYNKAKAARIVGINRTTLWRRMKELDIKDLG